MVPAHDRALQHSGLPLEFPAAIPSSISSFATGLVATRSLAAPFQVAAMRAGCGAAELQADGAFAQLSDVPEYQGWLDWLASWVARFGQLSDAATVKLRMTHSRHPTCPRFHTDAVGMRLIATLLGPGTQWLDPVDVACAADGNICQTPPADVIQQITPGSVAVFKGSAFDRSSGQGVVHRSPPDRIDRIVITLDKAA